MKKRVIYSDDGVIQDFSVNLDKYQTGTHAITFVAAEDKIFIGSRFPFNHIFIKLDGTSVNANASVMSVAYWDGSDFQDVVELWDETSSGGATLAQSGFVTWTTDKDKGWIREDTNHGGNEVTGLTDVEIYDLYWCRLTVSADLTADTTLSWLGQKFSDDHDLGAEHADVVRSGFIDAYESGKTDWEEQHVTAANLIIDDLIANKLIVDKNQILCREDLKSASVKKVANIIYTGMGADYVDDRDKAEEDYDNRINKVLPDTDKNRNARYDINEMQDTGRLYR